MAQMNPTNSRAAAVQTCTFNCQSKAVMSPLSHPKMCPFTYKEGAGDGGVQYDELQRGGSAGSDSCGGGTALRPGAGGTTVEAERASDQAPGTALPEPRGLRSGITAAWTTTQQHDPRGEAQRDSVLGTDLLPGFRPNAGWGKAGRAPRASALGRDIASMDDRRGIMAGQAA